MPPADDVAKTVAHSSKVIRRWISPPERENATVQTVQP
jgi:hypothetical protein